MTDERTVKPRSKAVINGDISTERILGRIDRLRKTIEKAKFRGNTAKIVSATKSLNEYTELLKEKASKINDALNSQTKA